MTVNEKITLLRKIMKEKGFDAYIVNGKDPHQSEYVSERWKTRQWLCNFTGSAGNIVITQKDAFIWTDSRYFIQCAQQVSGSFVQMKQTDGPNACSMEKFLSDNVKGLIGISAETLSLEEKRKYEKNNINLVPTEDFLNIIWTDRPNVPISPVIKKSDKICGESSKSKIRRIREEILKKGAQYTLISSLDDIAWILNLRANDIKGTPVFLAHLLISLDSVELFTQKERFLAFKENTPNSYTNEIYNIFEYEDITEHLKKIKNKVVYLNPQKINMKLISCFDKSVCILEGVEISTNYKARKNKAEMRGMKKAHILDGIALVNFIAKIKKIKLNKQNRKLSESYLTELSVSKKLEDERMKSKDYLEPSFTTIAAFADHGAIVHYNATVETDKKLDADGLLLIDSGGQYTFGTTDVTRTILLGKPTKEQKRDYTLVLKGHLALSSQIFPKGTTGHQLDSLAHQFLWNEKMNYYHGTGHGVGFCLSVHEGPQNISSKKPDVALESSMIVSDEPGLYKEGKYGIRIENLISVVETASSEFGTFYKFENLTCCPYERDLIEKKLLTEKEIKIINEYHKWVYKKLCPLVEKASLSYLKNATKSL